MAAYAALTFIVVTPLSDFSALDSATYEGDARLLVWTLAWDAHASLTGTPLFDANIYYPEPRALAFAEHHVGIGLFALPLYAATRNPILTYWIVWLVAFPLNALAMHALAWRITRDHGAAFSAGCIYAFCFFRMHHAHGHLQMLWTWPMPLVPLALDWWLERATAPRAAALTALVLLQALASWYLAVFVAIVALVSLAFLAPGTRITRAHVLQASAAAVVGGAVLAYFAGPYFALPPGPVEEAFSNSADASAYLLPPEHTWVGQQILRFTAIALRPIWGERTLYVGLAVLTLCTLGGRRLLAREWAGRGRERRLAGAILVTGCLALSLSFGPSPTGLAPFDLLARVPGLALLRAPARFALLVMMAAALLSAAGGGWMRVPLLVMFFFESFVVRFPAGKPAALEVPAVYRTLAALPRGAVLSLPTYRATPEAFREADYLLFSTAHWQPIVNGFGRHEPPRHGARMTTLARFPSHDAIALMRELGIRYVVMHTRRASELAGRAHEARLATAVRLLESADGDFLFEIR